MPALVPELYCRDIDISINFYKVLGFEIKFERPKEGFACLERDGAELMLDQLGQTRDWLAAPIEYPFGRGINLQITVNNIEGLYEVVQTHNIELLVSIETKAYETDNGVETVRQFIVKDPDGYLLRFSESTKDA